MFLLNASYNYIMLTCTRVQYGIEIFGQASCNNVKKIQTVQNKSLKTLFNLKM